MQLRRDYRPGTREGAANQVRGPGPEWEEIMEMLPMGKARQDRPVEYHGLIMPCCQVLCGIVVYAWGVTVRASLGSDRSTSQTSPSIRPISQSSSDPACLCVSDCGNRPLTSAAGTYLPHAGLLCVLCTVVRSACTGQGRYFWARPVRNVNPLLW